MGHLDPQGEIIPKEFPNPEQPRIWGGGGGENKLAWFLTIIDIFILHNGCYSNSLIHSAEQTQNFEELLRVL